MEDVNYMEMDFSELVKTVFTPGGDLKPCSHEASCAIIARLEGYYKVPGFGNANTGEINVMDAFIASSIIMNHKDKA